MIKIKNALAAFGVILASSSLSFAAEIEGVFEFTIDKVVNDFKKSRPALLILNK